jgi:branched-chain amino acid transport system substrate-binding protein
MHFYKERGNYMKRINLVQKGSSAILLLFLVALFGVVIPSASLAANAAFDAKKMGDMSDFDPNNPAVTSGDTIKIALVASFSGPAAQVGERFYFCVLWAAHDINKRGGLMVDGKKKLIQIIKADHMSKPDQCKKICERMVLQEKVQFFWGTNGSNMMKIMNEVASKYKIISVNGGALSDELMDATNFTRYSFMTSWTTGQFGRNLAYYYGQIRKKEKKFYILCQDYMFGHSLAQGFKEGLKEYYPEAQIVGEDYHKLFLTDFAPYLTKIKASGAEVIYTGDWVPDAANLLKQARNMGIKLPFAQGYLNDLITLEQIGVEGTQGLVETNQYDNGHPFFKTPEEIKYYKAWNNQWKTKLAPPFNTLAYEHPTANTGSYAMQTYWLLSVIERAGSTDAEKIIKTWEGDTYQYVNGKVVKMRACDHKVIQDLSVNLYVPPDQQKVSFNIPPYYWSQKASFHGQAFKVPADKVLPPMDQKLDRCKGKKESGD